MFCVVETESEDAGVTLTWGVGDVPQRVRFTRISHLLAQVPSEMISVLPQGQRRMAICTNPRLTRCVFPSPGWQMKVSYTCATTVTEAVHSSIPSELRKTRPHRILPAVLSACTGTRRRIKRINVFRSHFAHFHTCLPHPRSHHAIICPPIVSWSGRFLCRVVTSSKPPGMTSLLYR